MQLFPRVSFTLKVLYELVDWSSDKPFDLFNSMHFCREKGSEIEVVTFSATAPRLITMSLFSGSFKF